MTPRRSRTWRRALPAAWMLSACCLVGGLTRASTPVIWLYPPGPDATEGIRTRGSDRAESVAVGSSGQLRLAPSVHQIFPAEGSPTPPVVWSAAPDDTGNLYIGTGNTGEVFRIDPDGTATSILDSEQLGVSSLVVLSNGDVYAATFPSGGIYKMTARSEALLWYEARDRYIWSLAADRDGHLFAATGVRGIIYQVEDKDNGAALFDSDQTHVTTLTFDRSGGLLAGTDRDGLLYRISAGRPVEVLLDSRLREISSVTVSAENVIYAAAVGEEPLRVPRKKGEKSDLTIEVTPTAQGPDIEEREAKPGKIRIDLADLLPPRAGPRGGSAGRIYRIGRDRSTKLIWRSDTERVHALASSKQGLLFGTGSPTGGRVYRMEEDGTSTMLLHLQELQVTALAVHPDGRVFVCTGNPGHVHVLDKQVSASGTYRSVVFDAGRPATWGTLTWDADLPKGTRVKFATRSGNRPSPDETWSPWTPPALGEAASAIRNPSARFLQWRVQLSKLRTDHTPVVWRVKATVLPENRPPVVGDLVVLRPGEKLEKPGKTDATAPDGKKTPPDGARWISWKATDPDGDKLTHVLWIRMNGKKFQKHAEGITEPPFALRDEDLPEGRYQVRLEVDDSPSNGPTRALSTSSVSGPFLVDHTPPRLSVKRLETAGGRPGIEVRAIDGHGGWIDRAEYKVQGAGAKEDDWIRLPCRDGICDTANESFLLDPKRLASGRVMVIRVYDAAGNVTTVEAPPGT